MKIKSIENGYATLQKTRAEEEDIRITDCGVMIAPDDFAHAVMELNHLVEDGMPIEHFLGLMLDDPRGETRRLYLLINDGKADLSCVEVAA